MPFSGGVFASLASARPWVQAPALQNKLKKIGAKPTVEGCASNSSTQEAEEGKKSDVQGQPWLHSIFKSSLDYMKSCLKSKTGWER